MSDIEIMLNSHAHADHIEAHVLMKELTGAQVVMSEADGATLAEGGGVGTDGKNALPAGATGSHHPHR